MATQTHIQLHELGHLILRHRGHPSTPIPPVHGLAYEFDLISPEAVEAALKYRPATLAPFAMRWGQVAFAYASREEREAETIATIRTSGWSDLPGAGDSIPRSR